MAMENTPASSVTAMEERHGPRTQKARYHYDDVRSGFIELAPGPASTITPEVFRGPLRGVQGVGRVELRPEGTETRQHNIGYQLQEHSFFVYSVLAPDLGMEFELTRNAHTKNPDDPVTIAGVFKHQWDGLRSWKRGESCAKRSKERSSCQCGSAIGTSTSDKNIETLWPTTSILRRQTNQSLAVREAHLRPHQALAAQLRMRGRNSNQSQNLPA